MGFSAIHLIPNLLVYNWWVISLHNPIPQEIVSYLSTIKRVVEYFIVSYLTLQNEIVIFVKPQ